MKIYVDGHSDTLKKAFDKKVSLYDDSLDFNLNIVNNNIPVIQNFAAFIHPDYKNGFKRAKDIISYYDQVKSDTFLIKNNKDLEYVLNNKKIGIVLSIENGRGIDNSLQNVDWFYENGIRIMGLTWNEDNLIGCGALTENDTGLTEFGKEYVRKLEEKNILIDVSHSSEKTFWDTINNSNKTIIATHSNVYNICRHPRNLKDDQIKEIAKRDGIIGICYANKFLNENKDIASVIDVVKHMEYIIKLVGEDFVGLGSDFDGLSDEYKMQDINKVSEIHLIEELLKSKKYSQKTIDKIMGENWIRVLKKI